MENDVEGGPGWRIRGSNLRPVLTDIDAFRAGVVADALAEPIEMLWTGDPAGALERLAGERSTPRVRALRADCLRDLGEHAAAIAEYDRLVAEAHGSGREAVMRQHRGKALLAAGRAQVAISDFERALALRLGGDPTLLASVQQALEAAERPRRDHGLEALPIVEFGLPGSMRTRLVDAIAAGEKTATSSLLRTYEVSDERLPHVGDAGAVVDSDSNALFAIRITEVAVVPLSTVSSAHVRAEGEGFRSVAEWRAAHVRFWDTPDSRAELGDGFTIDDATLVLLERFERIH